MSAFKKSFSKNILSSKTKKKVISYEEFKQLCLEELEKIKFQPSEDKDANKQFQREWDILTRVLQNDKKMSKGGTKINKKKKKNKKTKKNKIKNKKNRTFTGGNIFDLQQNILRVLLLLLVVSTIKTYLIADYAMGYVYSILTESGIKNPALYLHKINFQLLGATVGSLVYLLKTYPHYLDPYVDHLVALSHKIHDMIIIPEQVGNWDVDDNVNNVDKCPVCWDEMKEDNKIALHAVGDTTYYCHKDCLKQMSKSNINVCPHCNMELDIRSLLT
jgi:hypothetical protein